MACWLRARWNGWAMRRRSRPAIGYQASLHRVNFVRGVLQFRVVLDGNRGLMDMLFRVGAAVLLAGAISLGWAGLVGETADPAAAAPGQTGTPTPGNTLFQDDFTTYSNRWQVEETPKRSVAYREAGLNIRIVSPGVSAWSVPDFDLALENYAVEVTAEFREGSPDSWFGLVVAYAGDENFYALVVSPQGEWRFLQHDGFNWIDLTPPEAGPVEREAGEAAVLLRVERVGDMFTFYVDDQLADHLAGEAVQDGIFGLVALSGRGYIDVLFDDILVSDIPEDR
jgi:hypothetical protein